VDAANPRTLLTQVDDIEGTEIMTQDLGKGLEGIDRSELLRSAEARIIPDPGVPNIKRVELYKNYRPLIPAQYRDDLCPHPGDDVLNGIRKERNIKQRKRQKKKKEMEEENKRNG